MKLELYGNPKQDYFQGIITYRPDCADCREVYMRTDYPEKRKSVENVGCVYLTTIGLGDLAPNDEYGPLFPQEIARLTSGCSKQELDEFLALNKKAYESIILAAQAGIKALDEIEKAAGK